MKILCSDFDGTLAQNGHISPKTVKAIKEFQQAGNLFGVVSGRGLSLLNNRLEKVGITPDFLILGNGALVLVNGKEIVTNMFSDSLVEEVYELINDYKMGTFAISDGKNFESKPTKWRFSLFSWLMKLGSLYYYKGQKAVDHEHILVVYAKDLNVAKTKKVAEELKKRFGDKIEAKVNVGINIDITAKGVTKENAITHLESEFPQAMIYTIGDGYNDVGMIKKYYGYAMASGKEEAKQVAKKIVNTVGEAIEDIMEEEHEGTI